MGGDDESSQGLLSVGQAWAELKSTARVEGHNAKHWWKEWAFREKTTIWKDISERWAKSEQPTWGACHADWALVLRGLVIAPQEMGLTLTMINLQPRYGSKARLQPFTKKAMVKFSLKSRLQDQSILPGAMGRRELARHELLPNPLTAEEDADGKKVSKMEEEEEEKRKTTRNKKKSKTKKTIKKMRIGFMHGKDSVRWKPFLMH
jgi:hypothetical protein